MKIPQNAAAAIAMLPVTRGAAVVIAIPPRKPSLANLLVGQPMTHAFVTHDPGTRWPDRMGQQLVEAALDRGGAAVLVFASLADAIAAHRRVVAAVAAAGAAHDA